MRTRLLRPELLTDEMLGGLPDGLVLFYVKLWLLTDDDGYFEWRPGQIAATLYPYRGATLRTRQVVAWLTALIDLGRVVMAPCGHHAVIPTIPRHRIKGGNMSFQYHKDHDAEEVRTSPDPSRPPGVRPSPDSSLSESGSGRDVDVLGTGSSSSSGSESESGGSSGQPRPFAGARTRGQATPRSPKGSLVPTATTDSEERR